MDGFSHYLEEYNSATSLEEKTTVLANYRSFLETLSASERAEARKLMQSRLKPEIKETMQRLDSLVGQANLLLERHEKVSF